MFFFGHIRVTSGRSYIRRALKQAMEIQCLWRALGGWVAAGHTHACKIHAVTLRCVNAFVCVFFEGISATATGDTTLLIFRPGWVARSLVCVYFMRHRIHNMQIVHENMVSDKHSQLVPVSDCKCSVCETPFSRCFCVCLAYHVTSSHICLQFFVCSVSPSGQSARSIIINRMHRPLTSPIVLGRNQFRTFAYDDTCRHSMCVWDPELANSNMTKIDTRLFAVSQNTEKHTEVVFGSTSVDTQISTIFSAWPPSNQSLNRNIYNVPTKKNNNEPNTTEPKQKVKFPSNSVRCKYSFARINHIWLASNWRMLSSIIT